MSDFKDVEMQKMPEPMDSLVVHQNKITINEIMELAKKIGVNYILHNPRYMDWRTSCKLLKVKKILNEILFEIRPVIIFDPVA